MCAQKEPETGFEPLTSGLGKADTLPLNYARQSAF